MKNKTVAVWLTLLLGPVGAHRVYLRGKFDVAAAALLLSTSAGLYGVSRALVNGLDDPLSWFFIPWAGVSISVCSLTAILYGLMDSAKWNARYNSGASNDTVAGQSNWFTVFGAATALFIGATALLASLAFVFQHYFEYQADQTSVAIKLRLVASDSSQNKANRTHQT